jgi:hypothetical protein
MSYRQTDPIAAALDIAFGYGMIDGEHHKMWVIDQMVRALLGEEYAEWVREHNEGAEWIREQNEGADGPDTFVWDEGIPP